MPGDGAVGQARASVEAARRKREADENGDGGREGRRRHEQPLHDDVSSERRPPTRSAAALSVRSQVNSGSVRPKWPNAAVFL